MTPDWACVQGGLHTLGDRYSLHHLHTEQVVHRSFVHSYDDLDRHKITSSYSDL